MPQSTRYRIPVFAALMAAFVGAAVVGGLSALGHVSLDLAAGGILIILAAGSLIGWWAASMVAPGGDLASPSIDAGAEGTTPYGALIDALPDPVLLVSASEPDDVTGRRYILANAAARDLLRLSTETGFLVTAIRDPEVLEAVDEALFGGISASAFYQIGGVQERLMKAFAEPLGDTPGGGRLALLVLRDETDIRRAERTRADFLANASHELRTPLASLSGFIETLRGHARTDEAARDKFLGIMQGQAERMSRLIDDLLSLSRIELNEHIAPADATDISLAVMDVVDSLAPLVRDRGVILETNLPEAGRAITLGDRDQILQVVQNLVDNAVKYSPRDRVVEITLETGSSAEAAVIPRSAAASRLSLLTPDHGPDVYAVLRVRDSGLGLAREHLPRLTERFYRVEGQKSGDRPGTGLGLAIVKHIMNRHRGGLAVESVEGQGAIFTVYFPQCQAARPDAVTKLS